MEQYWMRKQDDFKNLRLIIDNYKAEHLFIRLTGASGGDVKVNENLEGRTLDYKRHKKRIHFLIDNKDVYSLSLNDYDKGFSVAYIRIEKTEDGIGRLVMLPTGIDPYDESLPYPEHSIVRNVIDNHLVEITFEGMINLSFHSWWVKPHWKYWKAEKPGTILYNIKKQNRYGKKDK